MRPRHYLFPAALLLALALVVRADDVLGVKGDGVQSVAVAEKLPFTVQGPPGALLYFWSYAAGVTATEEGANLNVTAAPKGRHVFTVKAIFVDWDKKAARSTIGRVTVYVQVEPGPGPTPGPDPPGPTPDPPGPAPIPSAGLAALIIEETADRSKLPRSQLEILDGRGPGSVWDYLDKHCARGPDGTPERRIFDKDVDASGESKFWQDAVKLPRGPELPWLMVTNGKASYTGPLPPTKDETIKLLKKYGGE